MSLHTVKRLAARLLNAGTSRIRIQDVAKVREALTTDDVRTLIKEGAITVTPKQGIGRGKARSHAHGKKAGRGRGPGSTRGRSSALMTDKDRWMRLVRALRKTLSSFHSHMDSAEYRVAYRMVKGSAFRTRKQLVTYLKAHVRAPIQK